MNVDDILFEVIDMDCHLIGPMAHMKKREVDDLETATKLKSNGDLLYNMNRLEKMGKDSLPQWLGEVVHMSLFHPDRRRTMAAGIVALEALADVASDMATYHNITQSASFPMPKDLGFPEGLSMEEYFELLADHCKKNGVDLSNLGSGQPQDQQGQPQQGQGQGQEGEGEPQQGQSGGSGSGEAKEGNIARNAYNDLMQRLGMKGKAGQDHSAWGEIPVSAQEQAQHVMSEALSKSRGTLPAGLERLLKMLEEPAQVRWFERLRKMAGNRMASNKREWTYQKSSRRFGDEYPGVRRHRKGQIWGYLDTSGSMDDIEIGIALNEISAIAKAYSVPFNLIMADADVAGIEKITGKINAEKFKVKGGGGTSSVPVFKYLEKVKSVDLFIGFTDCFNEWPSKPPRFPCIWVTSTADKAHHPPFGETLVIERREKHRR